MGHLLEFGPRRAETQHWPLVMAVLTPPQGRAVCLGQRGSLQSCTVYPSVATPCACLDISLHLPALTRHFSGVQGKELGLYGLMEEGISINFRHIRY